MRDVLNRLRQSLAQSQQVALCRLVETRGSTPQKAGAMMLVFAEGSQAGTLGGGCVEAEVKRRALAVIGSGAAEIARFQLDNDYGWDDGLICGGRMQVMLEPCVDPAVTTYFDRLAGLVEQGAGATEAIVFDTDASGLPSPACFLFDRDAQLVAQLHVAADDCVASDKVRKNLRPLAGRPRPYAAHGVAYLPIHSRCRLVIVGGGHVGKAVAALAADLEFDVCVVDDREDIISAERFPRAEKRVVGKMGDVLPKLAITPETYCLIVTRGHGHDEEALFHLAGRGAAYVGMIGSRRKIKLIFDDLLQEGVSSDVLNDVYAPVGIDIGSQTVPEIAVSIAAQLVAHRAGLTKDSTQPQ